MPSRFSSPPFGRARGAALMLVLALVAALGAWSVRHTMAAQVTQPAQEAVRTDALVNQALDAPINLDQRNRPLPEVLQAITDKAFVPFRVTEDTWELLPYGRDTPITATVQNTSLRKTLQAITQKLGLTFALRQEDIEIRPLPALRRTARRATVQEIAGLDLLASNRMELLDERPSAATLLEAIDLRLQELDSEAAAKQQPEPGFAIENRLNDEQRERPVFVPRNATLLQALEAIHEQTDATWYPWGDSFIALPKSDWVRRQLDEAVNLTYNRVEVEQVLHDLQQAAGVSFIIEPGAVQRIRPEYRKVRLFLENATVREALESLGSFTGLGYVVNNEGVYIWNDDPLLPDHPGLSAARPDPQDLAAPGEQPGQQPILMVDMGEGTALLIYPSDLPADVLEHLDRQRAAAIARLRQSLPAPATQPAN